MVKKEWEAQIEEWKNKLFYSPNNIIIQWLKKKAKPKNKILDQGTGMGQYALTAYKMGFRKIVGLDFSEKLLRQARIISKKLGYKINFIKGDIRKMPFKPSTFNIIISAGIIEHVPETETALSELSRVIKKNGYLLIHIPHKVSTFTLVKKIQQFLRLWKLGYEKSFTIFEISELLHKHGFEILDMKINEFKPGKHKILGKLIQIIDKPLFKLGLGGHHLHLLCKKIK